MRRVALYILWLVSLLFSGCQPYPDHGDTILDFRPDSVDFGIRRELKLVHFQGDDKGLTLEFNQPLQRLSELDKPVPFEVDFRPRIPSEKPRRLGIASIRIDFADPLPPARRYTATVPAGWRALTGSALVRPQKLEWETARPALQRVEPIPGEASWRLTFNQPVDFESLGKCLSIPGLTPKDYDLVPLDSTQYEVRILTPVAVTALNLSAGLESLVGSLTGLEQDFSLTAGGEEVFFCEKSEWLPELGAAHFVFSEEVNVAELQDHLEGLDHTSGQLYSDNQKDYLLFLGDISQDRHITISDSLTAVNGARILHDVSLTATSLQKDPPRIRFRSFRQLGPSQTVLNLSTGKNAAVATWQLDRRTAVSLMNLSDKAWSAGKKLSVEYTPPLYKLQTKKAAKRTRFLNRDAPSGGLFLVRITEGKRVRRLLYSRSELLLEGWALNGVVTGFSGRLNGVPLDDVKVDLCDSKGNVVGSAFSEPDGTSKFSEKEHRGNYLWADESVGTALVPVVHRQVSPPITVPGMLWTHGKFFEPGQDSIYLGLWWSKGELPLIEVVDAGGQLVDVSISPAEKVGPFYQGRFSAPTKPGDYRIRFREGTGSHESALVRTSTIHVSRLAGMKGATNALLTLARMESGIFAGRYEWSGRGGSLLGLRAKLVARSGHVQGWTQVRPGTSDLIPIELEKSVSMSGGSYALEPLPSIQGRWDLVVEMFDRESPGTVVKSAVAELGEEPVELVEAESKTLSSTKALTRFRFEYTRFEQNGRKVLFCRLEKKEEGFWIPYHSGQATWDRGSYAWDVSLPASGTYRIHAAAGPNDPPMAVWQSTLRGAASARSQLELSPQPLTPGRRLSIAWPELKEGTPVWLSVLTGKEQVTQRRTTDQEGGLGEMTLPSLGLGQREIQVVSARLFPDQALQADSVRVDTSSLYQRLEEELLTFSGQSLVVEGQSLQMRVPKELRFGVVWWGHPDNGSADDKEGVTAAAGFVEEGQKLANLPLYGPLDFDENRDIVISAPSEAGEYALRVMGVSLEGTLFSCEQSVRVDPESRWEAVAPDNLRPGDWFAAGVRFWSDPDEAAPTGATTSVELESNLLPLTYQTTAALVDPGSVGDMLFSYRAPDFAADSDTSHIHLVWGLGVEGQAHRVETKLKPLPSLVTSEVFRHLTLVAGSRRRLNVPLEGHWLIRLTLQKDEPALVSLQSDQLGVSEVALKNPGQKEFAGMGEDVLEVELASGEEVQIEILELKAVSQGDRYSARGLYMLRELENLRGERVELDRAVTGERYLLAHHLVAPEEGVTGALKVPIPGGFHAMGVWLREGAELTAIPWNLDRGELTANLPELRAGEQTLVVLVDAHVGGDYLWPGSKVVGSGDELWSSTPHSRVKID